MDKIFKNRWAVVLGASSGFGAATAKRLAELGMNIIGVHLDRKNALANIEKLKDDIKSTGAECLFFNVNAADADKIREVLAEVPQAKGNVHVLMHSLAFGALKPFIEVDPKDSISKAQIDMTLDVMAHSLVYWAQQMHQNKFFRAGARIFAMTSAGSSRVWKSYGAVSAAKAALESHCRQLSLELAPKKISVNAVLAGVTDTPALRKIPGHEQMIATAQKRNPMGRLCVPEDVAQAIASLSMDGCEFITGNVIRVDGGENIVD